MSSTDFIPLVSSSENQRSHGGRALVLTLLGALALVGITTTVVLHSVQAPAPTPSLYDTAERVRVDKLMDHFEAMKELKNGPEPVAAARPARGLIYMNNTKAFTKLSKTYLTNNEYATDYFMMLQGYDVQINQAYCSVASTIAVLNSFKNQMTIPVDKVYDPYQYATQPDMFNECTASSVITNTPDFNGLLKPPGGLVLDQIASLIECNLANSGVEYNVETVHVDPNIYSKERIVSELKEALLEPNTRIVINYKRTAVNQAGGGHFSPIGAYSPQLDAFLVMDVAKYKYANAWIPSDLIYASLIGQDSCGSWNYPEAQLNLPPDASYTDQGADLWDHYNAILGCAPAYRGIIFVTVHTGEETL